MKIKYIEIEHIHEMNREQELFRVLEMKKPSFENWAWLVGNLLDAGFSVDEILRVTDAYSKSETYDRDETEKYICNHPRYRNVSPTSDGKHERKIVSIPSPTFKSGIEIINYFFSSTAPVLPLCVPENMKAAAHYYFGNGYTPLPKHPIGKHPGVRYENQQAGIHFRNHRFPESMIDTWEYKYGICLLGDHEHCFLDIDIHPDSSVNGVQLLDDRLYRMIHARHYERTKNGGYHVFGFGDLKTVTQVEGVEIRGNTALVVVYPTDGYCITSYV